MSIAVFAPGRPVWLLGVDGVIDGNRSGLSLRRVDLRGWDRRLGLEDVHPLLPSAVAAAASRGIDVRWVLASLRDDAMVTALAGEGVVLELPVITAQDLPADHVYPRSGIAATISDTWHADAARLLVPDDVPLLWTPSWQYWFELSIVCGSPGRGRSPEDVAVARSGPTTITAPSFRAHPITYMTDRDLAAVGSWIGEHGEGDSDD